MSQVPNFSGSRAFTDLRPNCELEDEFVKQYSEQKANDAPKEVQPFLPCDLEPTYGAFIDPTKEESQKNPGASKRSA